MTDIKAFRKDWNSRQKKLRAALGAKTQQAQAIALFKQHHGVLHTARVAQPAWSYEDDLLNDLTEAQWRRIPKNKDHSIVWNIWHLARIEDATMNILIASQPQVFTEENWQARINAPICHSGNEMAPAAVAALSEAVAVPALRAYRAAVGQRTQDIVSQLTFADFRQPVDATRLAQLVAEGVLLPEAAAIADYWGRRTIAGLLLMPPTRHNMVHLNEVYRLKRLKN